MSTRVHTTDNAGNSLLVPIIVHNAPRMASHGLSHYSEYGRTGQPAPQVGYAGDGSSRSSTPTTPVGRTKET
jgi:hypothetical protein